MVAISPKKNNGAISLYKTEILGIVYLWVGCRLFGFIYFVRPTKFARGKWQRSDTDANELFGKSFEARACNMICVRPRRQHMAHIF